MVTGICLNFIRFPQPLQNLQAIAFRHLDVEQESFGSRYVARDTPSYDCWPQRPDYKSAQLPQLGYYANSGLDP